MQLLLELLEPPKKSFPDILGSSAEGNLYQEHICTKLHGPDQPHCGKRLGRSSK